MSVPITLGGASEDAKVMTGSPLETPMPAATGEPVGAEIKNAPAKDAVATGQPSPVDDQQAGLEPPLYKGLKEFTDPKELATYTAELEQRLVKIEADQEAKNAQGVQEAETKTKTEVDALVDKPLSERLYTDPDTVLSEVKQSAKDELREEMRAEQAQKDFWIGFYNEHPDLKNADWVVDRVMQENPGDIKSMELTKGKEELVKEVRRRITALRENEGSVVSGGSASTLGVSGNTVSKTEKPVEAKPDFVSQLKDFQSKRRTTA